jgi:hypothetical protein
MKKLILFMFVVFSFSYISLSFAQQLSPACQRAIEDYYTVIQQFPKLNIQDAANACMKKATPSQQYDCLVNLNYKQIKKTLKPWSTNEYNAFIKMWQMCSK